MKIWLALFLSLCIVFPTQPGKEILRAPAEAPAFNDPASFSPSAIPLGEAAAMIRIEGEDWPLDAYGRALPQENLRDGLPQILGLILSSPVPGELLEADPEQQALFDQTLGLLAALWERDMLGHVTDFIWVDSDVIRFGYGEGLTVVAPADGDFSWSVNALKSAQNAFSAHEASFAGTLELTHGKTEARLLVDRWLPEAQAGEDGLP